jgi:hypothetical protein
LETIQDKVKPLLKEHKLSLRFEDEIVAVGDRVYVKATAILTDGESEVKCSAYAREAQQPKAKTDDAQLTGSTSSYARKYAANGMFLIDDSKDPDSQDNAKTSSPKVKSKPQNNDLATQKQRDLISDKLRPIGYTTNDEVKHYLSSEYGINKPLTKADADMVINDLLNTSGEEQHESKD